MANIILNIEQYTHLPLRQKIQLPFTMYYKIMQNGQPNHSMIYPGGMDSFTAHLDNIPHQHDHFELIYVLKGEMTNKIENITYRYRQGDACLLNRNTTHQDIPGEACTVVFINFSAEYINELLENDTVRGSKMATSEMRDFILSNLHGAKRFFRNYMSFTPTLWLRSQSEPWEGDTMIDQMQQELINQRSGSSYILKGLLLRLIHALEHPSQYHSSIMQLDSNSEDLLYHRILNYMKESNGRISRPELSVALNYNAEYLNQIIKKRTSSTLLKLGKTYRLDHAKELLKQKDLSIAQIIHELGFVSSSHFYNFFKEGTGMSPAQYRKR